MTTAIPLLSLPWKQRNAMLPWLINSTITRFTTLIVLPFKDQASADNLRNQLKDLSQKIHITFQPVFVSHKIERDLTLREFKPPVVQQQCLVYKFKCDLCDAGFVGFARRIPEHKGSS